jgi:cell division protein FtsB
MDRVVYKDKNTRNPTKRASPSRSIFNNVVTKIVLLITSIFLIYNVGHSISITVQKLNILQRARAEVDTLRLKNLELALLLDNIQGVEYLEIQARNRLKLSGEGEYIFIIPEEVLEGVDSDLSNLLGLREAKEERRVHEIWKDFLVKGV